MANDENQVKQSDLQGIDLVFEMGLRKVDEQLRTIEAIDSKMGILIGFIGTFAALLVGFFLGAEPEKVQVLLMGWTPLFFYPSLIFLPFALVRCFQAFKIHDYFAAYQFPPMVEWANEDPRKTKNAFMGGVLKAVKGNAADIRRKRHYANQGTWLILFALALLLLVLVSLSTGAGGSAEENGKPRIEAGKETGSAKSRSPSPEQTLYTATRPRTGKNHQRHRPG